MAEYIGKIEKMKDPPWVEEHNATIDRENIIKAQKFKAEIAAGTDNEITSHNPELRELGVYSEARFFRGQPYDDAEFQSLRGTYMIHVSRSHEKILVGAAGIHCNTGSTCANRYFLLETAPKAGFLNEFYDKVNEGCKNSREPVIDEQFKKFFETKEKIKPENSQNMMKIIRTDIESLKPMFVPMYYAPKNTGLDMLENIILSNTAQSAMYGFKEIPQNEMERYGGSGLPKPQVVFFYGVENKIIPTHETEDFIRELKNPKPKEQPKKSLWKRLL